MDAVLATDASVLIDDHRSFFILGDRFNGADCSAGGKVAVHTTVACPKRRESFKHRRLHSDPVGARQFVEGCARMIVPILAGLYTMAATDALGCIKQNAPRFTVSEMAGGNKIAVLLSQLFGRILDH